MGQDRFDKKRVLRFKSTRNYHEQTAAYTLRNWVLNKFITCLEDGSVIIVDNANYRSFIIKKVPNNSKRKQDVIGLVG